MTAPSILPVSPTPSADDLRSLAALVPSWFRLRVEDGAVLLTFHAPGATPPRPLATYAIRPRAGGDFAAAPLAELVTALAERVMIHYRAAAADASGAPLARVLAVANDPPLEASARVVPDGALIATTQRIHSAAAGDWFPDAQDAPPAGGASP